MHKYLVGDRMTQLMIARGTDAAPYLAEIAKLGMNGTISIELEYSPVPSQIEAWVSEAFEATAALMKTAGLR